MKPTYKFSENQLASLSALFCLILAYPIFTIYFENPNSHMYAYGGDPLAIYYDIAYHVCYGSGTHLTNMNYPHGELLFLTDAQGSFTFLLNNLNKFIPGICENTVGIMNGTAVILLPVASFIMFHLLRSIGVTWLLSLIFSPLIILLSPQVIRMGAHFGLGYPFLIPLTMLWFVRKTRIQNIEWRDFFFFTTLLFFAFNNAYIGFMCSVLLLFAGIIHWYFFNKKKISFYPSIMGFTTLILPYLYFKLNDPVNDRIQLQWGFFHYYAKLEGLFFTPDSLSDKILKKISGKGFNMDFEAMMNVGIVTTVILFIYLITLLTRRSDLKILKFESAYKSIFFTGLILFLYASAIIFLPFSQEFIEDKLGVLLMFKASGRIAWPMYFVLTITSILILDQWMNRISGIPVIYLIFIPALIWIYEIKTYIKPKFRDTFNENFFSAVKEKEVKDLLNEASIKTEDFQAILCIPKMMMWNDNFQSNPDFETQFFGVRLSKATGMPMISSMLSRMSTDQISEGIELLASPYIYKSLVDKLPDKRPILIVSGKSHPPLQTGEQFLMSVSDTLIENERFILASLNPEKINNNPFIDSVCNPKVPNLTNSEKIFHLGFDDKESEHSYFNKGSLQLEKGEHEILNLKIDSVHSEYYVFSAWTRFDHKRYGIGNFKVSAFNEKGEVVFEDHPDSRFSNDIHDDWILTEIRIPILNVADIRVSFHTNRKLFIDEVLLRPENEYHVAHFKDCILYNGYRVCCLESK